MNYSLKISQSLFRLSVKSLAFIPVFLYSCIGRTTGPGESTKYTEDPVISYAKRFTISKLGDYSLLSVINPWQGANGLVQQWYLVPRGLRVPDYIDTSEVIKVPVRKIICMSTTHIAMISALNETSTVKGFSGTRYLFSGDLLRNVENGIIHEIGYEDNLNKELIMKLDPDLVMVYGIGSESAGYIGKLKEVGLKVLFNADYLEEDPLGKAEWIKMIGALYDKEDAADSIFKTIEDEYNRLKLYISENVMIKPKVMLGLPFKDTWYISPGNSYISSLIGDAGGDYIWKNTMSSVSMPTGLENVFLKALRADYWLNTGNAETRREILSLDPRLAELPCFKEGNLFNNNKRTNEKGGNDYWEGGSLNPHLILNDIASILHPELFSGRELFYYKIVN